MISRRQVFQAGGLWLAGLALGRLGWSAEHDEAIEVLMRSDLAGARVAFDPIGLLVRPGQRVRWVNDGSNVHTTTAYHPANSRHALRIPDFAAAWDSGFLVKPGDAFEVRLSVEGIYDYFCAPHEAAGMVGRIIVAKHDAGKSHPEFFKPYPNDHGHPEWRMVPEAALRCFPAVETILKSDRAAPDNNSIWVPRTFQLPCNLNDSQNIS